jgi:hypothetical protein
MPDIFGPTIGFLPLAGDLTDDKVRKNFESLDQYHRDQGQLDGFVHMEFTLQPGDSHVKIKHGLGFVPKDVILTRLLATSGAKLTLHHAEFDTDYLVASYSDTATTEARVRMFVGAYRNSSASPESFSGIRSDQEFSA